MACVEKVYEAVKGRAEIIIECHGRFDLPTALRVCEALEPSHPLWVEEPILPDTTEALADLRRRVRVPLSFGERPLRFLGVSHAARTAGAGFVIGMD